MIAHRARVNSYTLTNDIQYMLRAYNLALKGLGTVSPNPMVGAVVVKNDTIIGEGFHLKKGEAHAEVNAINNSLEPVEGATLFCTLEPCCHTNKTTPPCTEFLIQSKIKKVVIGSLDPNPEVSGRGVKVLRAAGIEVITGVLEHKCNELNKVFFKNMKTNRPFVHLKVATTLDGKMASKTGSSKWITSSEARKEVHELRMAYDAVMIGKGTLIVDKPKLTARKNEQTLKEPVRIVVGNLDGDSQKLEFFNNPKKVINLYSEREPQGIKGIKLKASWDETLRDLYKAGVTSILVEGGPKLLSSLIEENAYDKLTVYVAPKLIGNGPALYQSEKTFDMENVSRLNGHWRLLSSGEAVYEVGA